MKLRTIAGLVCVLATQQVNAEWEHHVVLNGASFHFTDTEKYNAFNYGIGGHSYFASGTYLSYGYYRNSEYGNSLYAGMGESFSVYKDIRVGYEVGFVTGYNAGSIAGILPTVWVENIKCTIIPPVGTNPTWVIGAQLEL